LLPSFPLLPRPLRTYPGQTRSPARHLPRRIERLRCAYYTDVSDTNAAKNLVPNLRMIDTLAEPRATRWTIRGWSARSYGASMSRSTQRSERFPEPSPSQTHDCAPL